MRDTSRASAPQSPPSIGVSPSTTTDAEIADLAASAAKTATPPPLPVAPIPPPWNKFDDPRPYVTVSGLAVDGRGRTVLIHRSENVRSARNCWSLPSGLHEVGLSMAEQFGQELREELNLRPVVHRHAMVGLYENIRPDGPKVAGWHWVIAVMVMRVESFDCLKNQEPDKHDRIEVVNIRQDWVTGRAWAPMLREFLVPNIRQITTTAFTLL
jgi:ADP-ribose pyrophosphatase YjhB (NUDIX family)